VKLFDKEEDGFYPFVFVTDRWQTHAAIPFNERACTLCLKLEDELHFLLEWPL